MMIKKLFPFYFLIIIAIGACKTVTVATMSNDDNVYTALLVNDPPDSAKTVKVLRALGDGAEVVSLSISPNGLYTVVSLSRTDTYWTEIFHTYKRELLTKFNSTGVLDSLKKSAPMAKRAGECYDIYFEDDLYAYVNNIRWLKNSTAVLDVAFNPQGQSLGNEPYRSILFDIPIEQVLDQIGYISLEEDCDLAPLPAFDEKNKFSPIISPNGLLLINGTAVEGVPPDLNRIDMTVVKE